MKSCILILVGILLLTFWGCDNSSEPINPKSGTGLENIDSIYISISQIIVEEYQYSLVRKDNFPDQFSEYTDNKLYPILEFSMKIDSSTNMTNSNDTISYKKSNKDGAHEKIIIVQEKNNNKLSNMEFLNSSSYSYNYPRPGGSGRSNSLYGITLNDLIYNKNTSKVIEIEVNNKDIMNYLKQITKNSESDILKFNNGMKYDNYVNKDKINKIISIEQSSQLIIKIFLK